MRRFVISKAKGPCEMHVKRCMTLDAASAIVDTSEKDDYCAIRPVHAAGYDSNPQDADLNWDD